MGDILSLICVRLNADFSLDIYVFEFKFGANYYGLRWWCWSPASILNVVVSLLSN